MTSKKAAKDLWYQDLLDAFSFEEKGPKEKALQKEKGRIAQAAGLPLLKKRGKTIAWFVQTTPLQIKIYKLKGSN